jgi:hypothetical protein
MAREPAAARKRQRSSGNLNQCRHSIKSLIEITRRLRCSEGSVVSVSTCVDEPRRTAAIHGSRAEALARRLSLMGSFKSLNSICWRNQTSPWPMCWWLGHIVPRSARRSYQVSNEAPLGRMRTKARHQAWLVKRPQFDSIVTGTRPISRHELFVGRTSRKHEQAGLMRVLWADVF